MSRRRFLLELGLDTLRDLSDFEAFEDAGLLSKERLLTGDSAFQAIGEVGDDGDGLECDFSWN